MAENWLEIVEQPRLPHWRCEGLSADSSAVESRPQRVRLCINIVLCLYFQCLIKYNSRLGALDSTAKILDAAFFDDFPCSVLKKQEMIAPFIPEKFVDLNKFKSESKAARYVREKKPYAAHDAELSSQWEAFNALILQNTVPIGEIK